MTNINQKNYDKARETIARLVKHIKLQDAPPPFYKDKQKDDNQKPIPQNKNHKQQQPIDYPVTMPQASHYSSNNNFQNNSFESNIVPKTNEEKGQWHISMLADTKLQSSRKISKPKPPLNFKSACTLAVSYNIANVKQWQDKKQISDNQLYKALNTKFKIQQFRNNQKAIVKCTMMSNDVFVCMPTGGGKSLTFQLPLSLETGVTFCILPLVSLIIDQQMQAQKMKLKAYGLTGNTEYDVVKQIYQAIRDCQQSNEGILIFSTPQKLNKSQKLNQALKSIYDRGLFKRIVIDEVHCVSTWGRDFRKQYQRLGFLKKLFPSVPILALTATASEQIRQDIVSQLGIKGCYFFQSSFNRPNLRYEVRAKNTSTVITQISQIIQQYKGKCGIIYCSTRKQTQQIANNLRKHSISAHHFHGDMSQKQKKDVQQKWTNNVINIVVATIAFGMGINKPDVRYVIHYSFSKSLQNYYQQSGRAGRDGQQAQYKNTHMFLISKNADSTQQNKNYATLKLNQMISYCQDKSTCRRKMQLNYFGQEFDTNLCNKTCDNCRRGDVVEQFQGQDCFQQAQSIMIFLWDLQKKKQTLTQAQLCDFIKGNFKKMQMKQKFFQKKNINNESLSSLKSWSLVQLKNFIRQMLGRGYLYEQVKKNKDFFLTSINTSDIKLEQIQQQGTFYYNFINKKKVNKKIDSKSSISEQSVEDMNFDISNFEDYKYNPPTLKQKVQPKVQDDYADFLEFLEDEKRSKQLVMKDNDVIQELFSKYMM